MTYYLGFRSGYRSAQIDVRVYGTQRWRHGLLCPRWPDEPGTTKGKCVLADNGCDGRWVVEIDVEDLRKERIGQ